MHKTALLFAGQGAQEIGMGLDLAQRFPSAKTWFDRANTVLGYDLASICFHGPEPELTKTEHAQPAIYLVGWIAFQLLKEHRPQLQFEATAGLSLGEFTALAAAGALTFEDGLRIVRQRGQYMQQACETTRGGMAAIIGLDETATRALCAEADVELANLNCPGQLVISGAADNLSKACDLAKAKGAKRALPLTVAGAYHSRLMAGAAAKLAAALQSVPIAPPQVPVISNVTAQPHTTPDDIRRLLVQQVTASVLWEKSIRHLLAQDYNRFIELGPGAALTGFNKRIHKDAQTLNISNTSTLQTTLQSLP